MLSVVNMSSDRVCGESVGEGLKCPMQVGPESMEPHGMCAIHVTCTVEKPCHLCDTRPKEYFIDLVARRASLGIPDVTRNTRSGPAVASGEAKPSQSARTAGKVAPEGDAVAQKAEGNKKKKRGNKRKADGNKDKEQQTPSAPLQSRSKDEDNRLLVDPGDPDKQGESTTAGGGSLRKRRKEQSSSAPTVVSETISQQTTVGGSIPERWIPIMGGDGIIEAMECVSSQHCPPGTRKVFNMPAPTRYRPADVTVDSQSNMSRSSVLEVGNSTITSSHLNADSLDPNIFGSPSNNSDSGSDTRDLSSDEDNQDGSSLLERLDTHNNALQVAIDASTPLPTSIQQFQLPSALANQPVDATQLILDLMKENERRKQEDNQRLEKAMQQIDSLTSQ